TCDIRAEGAYQLCFQLQNCINLSNLILDIRCNSVLNEGIFLLGVALAKLQNLLDFSLLIDIKENIGIQGWKNFYHHLQGCQKLQILKLQPGLNLGNKFDLTNNIRKVKKLVKFQIY
ncbi:hypothetical protein ABPG72_009306, partial [Tetrahymena utriculariae]